MSNDNGWLDHAAAELPAAEAAYIPTMQNEPHDGETTDMNLHLHDMLAGPNPNVPDVMADYVPGGES